MRLFSTILGFVLATVAGTGLSVFVLIASQGMNNKTPVLPVVAAYLPLLAIAHGLGAAAGLMPVRLARGKRTWKFAVCGFAAGGAFEGLLLPIWLLTPNYSGIRFVAIAGYFVSLLLPAAGGVAGLLLESRRSGVSAGPNRV